ncbi:MAG: LLM class flavin-dependent oxidoreductase [Candidatus Limnocylindria bacterium]
MAGTPAASVDIMKIGLMLPLGDDETTGFPDLRAMAVAAEDGGLDSIWGADHLIFREGGEATGIHECWTVLTALAAVTSRVEIGPLVLALPFRNPALTAKMAAELDEVSGGRLILGLGCGWHEPEFDAFNYPFDHRVSRFDEGLQVLVPLLREGRVDFAGEYHRAIDAELRPRPVREGGPPILIAGKQPRMLELVARHADQWNAAWYGHPDKADELRVRLANLRAALDAAGRDPTTLEITAGIFVAFEGADADAPERAIRGSMDEVAAALAGYAELGVSHLIAHVYPRTTDAVTLLGEAAALARDRVATSIA